MVTGTTVGVVSTIVGWVTPVVPVVSFPLTTTVSSITVYPPSGCSVVVVTAPPVVSTVDVVTLAPV